MREAALEFEGHDGLRLVATARGEPNAPTVLLLHGQPTWSYLYRKMIPVFARAGYHVLAPDCVGFGRTDKPTERSDYTFARHVRWLSDWLLEKNLRDVNLFCQDWGGLLGLRLVARYPDLFDAVVAANTFLPTGQQPVGEAFTKWQQFSQQTPEFNVGKIIQGGCKESLSEQVRAASRARVHIRHPFIHWQSPR